MIEKIFHKNLLFAIVVRNKEFNPGISFLTDDCLTQQLALMKYDKGYCIQPHYHLPIERVIHGTPETIIINKGALKVNFYDEGQSKIDSTILFENEIIMLINGGHGFEVLKDETEIIEIKQGPFQKEKDKIKF
jgi:hypothetical protein